MTKPDRRFKQLGLLFPARSVLTSYANNTAGGDPVCTISASTIMNQSDNSAL